MATSYGIEAWQYGAREGFDFLSILVFETGRNSDSNLWEPFDIP